MKVKKRDAHVWEKDARGFYVEPEWCARRLFEVEDFSGVTTIYDPACGWGTITKAAQAWGARDVYGSDIVNRRRHGLGDRFSKVDFLSLDKLPARNTAVVCNPPFEHVREFCENALALGAAKVAMIFLVRRLNAAHWLLDLPLRTIYLLSPRPSMPPGKWIAQGNDPGGGTQDFCWLFFSRDYRGEAKTRWLMRDG